MFSSSQALLFRSIPALNKLKIHHQLPLTPQESRQLLNLLTNSFRQHLDKEHGSFKVESGVSAAAHSPQKRGRRASDARNSLSPTERHMHSMLTNPLFNGNPNTGTLIGGQGTRQSFAGRNPLDMFDVAVARGMMTTGYATIVLDAVRRGIISSSVPDVRDGMRKSGAGLKVLKWLKASGATNNLEFLKDNKFAEILIDFMVAEDLEEAVWPWIKISLEERPVLSSLSWDERPEARKRVVQPLLFLIKAETKSSFNSLDTAYMSLSRAAGYMKAAPTEEMIWVLGVPTLYLWHETVHQTSRGHLPASESSFETFLSLLPNISHMSDIYLARIALYHPTKPNPELALEYLRTLDAPRNSQSPRDATGGLAFSSSIQPGPHPSRLGSGRHSIHLALDTAKYLLENDRYSEAEWVMELLRTRYPQHLGLRQEKQIMQAKAEAASLELLENLGIA